MKSFLRSLSLKDWFIAVLVVSLVGSMAINSSKIKSKNDTILDLRMENQNISAKLDGVRVELDDSQTALTAVRDLNHRKDEELNRLDEDLGDVRTVLARTRVELAGAEETIELLSQPVPQDTTQRTFAVRTGHVYAEGWFQIVSPYPISVTLGSDSIEFQTTLYVTDDRKLAMNYKLYGDGPAANHVFTEVDEDLFKALFSENVSDNPIAQISWLKRILSGLEFGLGVGMYGPDPALPLSVEIKYNSFALEALGTTKGSYAILGKYYFKPF